MIALIITIIVMVTLAGAAISSVVVDDAVITKSKKSVSEQNTAQAQEEVKTAWADLEMGFWMDTTDVKRSDYFTVDNLEVALAGKGTISELNYVPGGTTTGKYVKDEAEYEFTLDTTDYTDVTTDSFGTTSGGYGEGADVVPDTNTTTDTITNTTKESPVMPTGYVLSGEWVFNDIPDVINTNIKQSVNFATNGYNYITMVVGNNYCMQYTEDADEYVYLCYQGYDAQYDNSWWIRALEYDESAPSFVAKEDRYDWFYDEQKIIDFGSIPQSVTEEFYVWFTSNAVKQ